MKKLSILLLCAAARLFGQAYPSPWPEMQFLDSTGKPLAGAKLCTYTANTSTPQATYTDATGLTANTNPVILDVSGRASIWLGPVLYKFVLMRSGTDGSCNTGQILWTQDQVGALFTVGGNNGYVQYSQAGGMLGGDPNFYWNKLGRALTIIGSSQSTAGLTVANSYIQTEVGLLVQNIGSPTAALEYNAVQVPYGGMYALSFTAKNYIQAGNSAGPFATNPPPVTSADGFHAGAISYDIASACLSLYNGGSWSCLGAGGGGGGGGGSSNLAAGPTNAIQYNAGGGVFGGSSALVWNSSTQLLSATAIDASHAAIAVATGFMQADQGFLATSGTATNYNAIQAPTAGMAAKSFTATAYVQVGHGTGAPTLTTSDAFHPGALYWDDLGAALQVYNGSAWVSLAGGTGAPGGSTGYVQFDTAGAFAGSGNFTWSNSGQLLTVAAVNSSSPGIAVGTGFMQADQGFLATTGTATRYNVIQAQGGGMAAKSFTATGYLQAGNYAGTLATGPTLTASDAFHAGAISYSTAGGCLALYNGSSWACMGGSGGTPGGSSGQVQFNLGGAFSASVNLTYSSQLLTAVASSSTVAGMAVQNGFMQADAGFLATSGTANRYNSIQAPTGGLYGRSVTALTYIQTGQSYGAPALTTGDSFNAGAMFWNSSAACEQVFNGSAWSCMGGSAGVASLNGYTGAMTLAGTSSQVNVSSSSGAITLSTPQSIATNSSVTFANVTTGTGGVFQSGATGSSIAFQTTNYNFQVNGSGVVSAQQFNQGGNTIINTSGQFVGAGVNVGSNGISAGNYNLAGGYTGATLTVPVSTVPGCSSLSFRGGILIGCS